MVQAGEQNKQGLGEGDDGTFMLYPLIVKQLFLTQSAQLSPSVFS